MHSDFLWKQNLIQGKETNLHRQPASVIHEWSTAYVHTECVFSTSDMQFISGCIKTCSDVNHAKHSASIIGYHEGATCSRYIKTYITFVLKILAILCVCACMCVCVCVATLGVNVWGWCITAWVILCDYKSKWINSTFVFIFYFFCAFHWT